MIETKSASHSVGVIAQVIAIIIMGLKLAGVDVSADLANAPENIGNLIDAAMIVAAQATALWGRLRATREITSLFKPKQ